MTIPYNFEPRDYQLPLLQAIDNGIKRAYCIWHRRAGKDKTLINLIAKKAIEKVGVYYYFFPTYSQGKKVIWDGIDGDGFSFMNHFPKEITKSKNSQELKLELINGSIFQIVGTDKYDSVRGTNPVGCIFSEIAFQNPMAWEIVRPILAENGGWAVFNTTPNGKNHSYDIYESVKDNDSWFCEVLTVDDTKRDNGDPVVGQDIINEERDSGMSEEMVQQEYYCSFDIGAIGSFYSDEMNRLQDEDRICRLPFYIEKDVDVYFDLGMDDMMSIWFKQESGQEINFVNYYENNSKKIEFYCEYIDEYIKEKKGKLGIIYVPHDANKRELITGKAVFQVLQEIYGEGKVIRIPIGSLNDGIQSVRRILPKCSFDKGNCKQGIRCLENYKREYDQLKKVFRKTPSHDWASHGADAFRYFAISHKEKKPEVQRNEKLENRLINLQRRQFRS